MVVALSAAAGDFTLPDERPDRLLFISGGSGITPVMAMLRTLVDEGHAGEVTFLHYAHTAGDVIFASELAEIATAHPNVRMQVVTTQEADGTSEPQGRFTPAHLAPLGDLSDVEVYACGPVGLVDTVLDHWDDAGLTERLHVERFVLVAASAVGSTAGSIRFAVSDRTIQNDGRTLLVQAEDAGLRPANGCRMGICHTCTRRKVSGTVQDVRTGALSTSGGETVQLCVTTPVSDVVVDL
jgi:ferredoxin-NADP reductase